MWILHWLPDSIILFVTYVLFALGLALYTASKLVQWIPIMRQYRLPAELVGIVAVIVAAYFYGGYSTEMTWRERVRELEARVKTAEEKSQQVNTVVQTRVVEKIKVVKENVYINKEIIREVAGAQLDNQCTLPRSTVSLHDSASRNEVARGPESTDGTPSDVKASTLLETVVDNYGSCHENAEKLKAWQQWYREQKKIFESVK
jgi:hypothetical protein